jgi:hypothetical protein
MYTGAANVYILVAGTSQPWLYGHLLQDAYEGNTGLFVVGGEHFPAGAQDIRIGPNIESMTSHSAGSQAFLKAGGLLSDYKKGTLVQYADVDPRTFYLISVHTGAVDPAFQCEGFSRYIKCINASTNDATNIYFEGIREIA